jgi:uncharacterized damage-inducible protein DinB
MELKAYIKMELDGLKHGLDRVLKDLPQAELSWRPACGCNSIGLILFHCARAEDSFIHGMLQNTKQIWETGGWCKKMNKPVEDGGAHYTVDQVNAFEVPQLKDILAYWDVVRADTLKYLDSLTMEQMDRKIKLPWAEMTVAGIFSLIVGHTSQHIGEMSYLRGLLRGMDK